MTLSIPEGEWVMFWSLKMTLTSGSMLAHYQTRYMEKEMGWPFRCVLIVSKKGFTTCYIRVEDRKEFGEYHIQKYVTHGNVQHFAHLLQDKATGILNRAEDFKTKKITREDLRGFVKEINSYNGYHVVPRAIVDFIDQSLISGVIEDLKAARISTEPVHSRLDSALLAFARQLGSDRGYNPEHLLCMTLEEIERYIETGIIPGEEELAKRYDQCGLVYTQDCFELTTQEERIEELESLHTKSTTGSIHGELKGNSAFKGIAVGVARIVFDPSIVTIFNKGDILITGMTRPEYVPLMEKAGAIVTDAGGLLCHAAIVARELGKPCVIGTKIATSVFKEGDIVEVNADTGIVKTNR